MRPGVNKMDEVKLQVMEKSLNIIYFYVITRNYLKS
jgi:hypothetical protein